MEHFSHRPREFSSRDKRCFEIPGNSSTKESLVTLRRRELFEKKYRAENFVQYWREKIMLYEGFVFNMLTEIGQNITFVSTKYIIFQLKIKLIKSSYN